jgi:hypothetical protein
MAGLESPFPPALERGLMENLTKLVFATQLSTVATLTAAIVTSMGRQVSIAEVMEISNDLHMAMFPQGRSGISAEWEKTKSERLARVRA